MAKWLRRLRGALGIGLTWAGAWTVLGPLIFVLFVGTIFGFERVGIELLLDTVGFFALSGLVGGATFSAFLGLAEGHRTLGEMSLPRFGGWGALAGAATYGAAVTLFGSGWGLFTVGMTAIAAVLGSGSAAGSLALARKADEGRLLEAPLASPAGELKEEQARGLPKAPE